MDSLPPSLHNFSDTNPNSAPSHNPIVMGPATSFPPTSDNSRTNNRYTHLQFHHLGSNDNHSLTTTSTDSNLHHNQASEFATQSFQDIRVDSSILEKDPIICCPICKEEFSSDLEVKMLPCKHMFHTECILQWLKIKNSCPVCRFQLPTNEDEECDIQGFPRGENFVGTMISEDLLDDDDSEDEFLGFWVPPIRRVPRSYDLSVMYHTALQTDDILHRPRYRLHHIVETRNFLMMRLNGNRSEIEDFLHIGLRHQLVMGSETGSEDLLLLPMQSREAVHSVGAVESSNCRENLDDEGMFCDSVSS